MARLGFETTIDGGVAVIALTGELDLSGATRLEQEIDRVTDMDGGPTALVVDLSRLDFMDSSGLRLLVLVDQRSRTAGRRFGLVPGGDTVQRVFDITRMRDHLTFVSDPAELAGGARDETRNRGEAGSGPGE